VAVVQRFDSAAQLNIHFHVLAADGVFIEAKDGALSFHSLPEPAQADLLSVAWRVCERTVALLREPGALARCRGGRAPGG
jgi:hypothetical protein